MRSKYKEDNPFARLHTEIASKEKRSPWDELLKAVSAAQEHTHRREGRG